MQRGHDIPLLLARWVLAELPPEDVPGLATDALVGGCEAASVAVLAGLTNPTSADIEDELGAFLREMRLRRPTHREALKAVVDRLARDIVLGAVEPAVGAERMYWRYTMDDEVSEDRELWDQLSAFVGLAIERDEEYRTASELDPEVVAAAKALLDAGGLRISAAP